MDINRLWSQSGLQFFGDIESVTWAIVAIAVAMGAGWLTARYAGAALAVRVNHLAGTTTLDPTALTIVVRNTVIALVLLVGRAFVPLDMSGLVIVAVVLALTTAQLVRRGLTLVSVGPPWAMIASILVFVLAMMGTLGGLVQLTTALDSIGLTFGTRRFTILSVITLTVISMALYFGARLLNRIVRHSIERTTLDPSQQVLAQKLAGIAIVVGVFLLGVDVLAIDLTTLKIFSGAVGLAIGFGLQKTFGNLIAGVILLMDKSIKPGDVIAVGDTFGSVNKIGVRAVSVVTRDGKEHLIPNENLMTQEVENWSYSSRHVRIHIPVGIGYGSNIKVAQRLMAEAATASLRVLAEPKPAVWLKGFGDNSVDHEILVWVADPEAGVGNVQSEILNRLWHLFAENGIEIPFPQRDIHIRSLPAQPKSPSTA